MDKNDSLKKRYFFKLSTNYLGMLIGLVTAGIVPRSLGPKAYGEYNFLTNFFMQVVNFLDMGTSMAFYTKISQRPKDKGIVRFYSYFTVMVAAMIFLFVLISFLSSLYKVIWPDQIRLYIIFGAMWGILSWLVQILNKMTDAYGLTVPAELVKIFQRILAVILLLALFIIGQLNLFNFFLYQYFIITLLLTFLLWVIISNKCLTFEDWSLKYDEIKKYTNEFYEYSHPLFVGALAAMAAGILDRWILQTFAGSVQQGFFGLSYVIGSLCFLFTSAMQPLLMRELSIAHAENNIRKMAALFRRYTPLLFSMAAYFSCFIALQAGKVIHIFGGRNYDAALLPVVIMAFYPIHQTYGQLNGSVFLASGQTRLSRNIDVSFMLIGFPLIFFLLAPRSMFGLNAGAAGLAIKMVILQFLEVNIQLLYCTKFLKITYWKYLAHQVLSIAVLLGISFVSMYWVDFMLRAKFGTVFDFVLAGLIYTFIVLVVLFSLPDLFGLKRGEIIGIMRLFKNRLFSKI